MAHETLFSKHCNLDLDMTTIFAIRLQGILLLLAYLLEFGFILSLLPLSLQSPQSVLLSSLLFFTHAFEFGR